MKKGLKKLIAIASAISVLGGMGTALVACDNGGDEGSTVVIGNTTELGGDFRWPGIGGSSAGAADQDVSQLTSGYSTMELDRNGNYVWNNTVVKEHTEGETDDGTYKVTIEIKPGLKMSDGTEVTADNYLAYILVMSSAVGDEGVGYDYAGQTYAGYYSYNAYEGGEEGTKEFSGIRKLGDYKFSFEISTEFYPYYYVETFGAISPYDTKLFFGNSDLSIKDDGQGAYIATGTSGKSWFAEGDDGYEFAEQLEKARFDVSTYAYTGPYTVSEWNSGDKKATLKKNPYYAGNFEGQKPNIDTLVYAYVAQDQQINAITAGTVDILLGVTGGDDTKAALDAVQNSNGKLTETHYDRAGYGKIEFECDFGPTMFKEVRQAISYCFDKNEFAQTFTGGYGSVVYGPYCGDFPEYQANKDAIGNLNAYNKSITKAKEVLEAGGWVYNADGTAYSGTGVRYKKLTAAEAEACDGANKVFKGIGDAQNYATTKVGDDYYMPCVINYLGTEDSPVTDLINTMLVQGTDITDAGMLIKAEITNFNKLLGEIYRLPSYGYGGTPTYGMLTLATGWNYSIQDYSFNWSHDPHFFAYSLNKLYDEYDVAFPYYKDMDFDAAEHDALSYDEAVAASGGKLGMDYISMAMVYDVETGDTEEFNKWWVAYMTRWNELLPDIPLYSNIYYDVYNSKIKNFNTSAFWQVRYAILYATCD